VGRVLGSVAEGRTGALTMINYDEGFALFFRCGGSVLPKAFLWACPSVVLAAILSICQTHWPGFEDATRLSDVTESQLWTAMTACIVLLVGFRTRQALGRFWEGTSLLHQMRGEWFDSVSCLTSFSRASKSSKPEAVAEFRQCLIRLTSLMHGSALDEISDGQDQDISYEVIDIRGLDSKTLQFLRDCTCKHGFNRVEALQHMIQVLITHNISTGVLTIPPPILSRVYQTLSRGLVNLLNAKKIKDTMFPFPYAQVIFVLLVVHSIFTPVMITQAIPTNLPMTGLITFFPSFGLWSLNFAAQELEMPFGQDINDLPMQHFQQEMNESLLLLSHDMADHVVCTSPVAVEDFHHLHTNVTAARHTIRHEDTDEKKMVSHSKAFLVDGFLEEIELFEEAAAAKEEKAISLPGAVESAPAPAAESTQKAELAAVAVAAVAAKKEQSTITVESLHLELTGLLQRWSEKSELQVAELCRNTQALQAMSEALPSLERREVASKPPLPPMSAGNGTGLTATQVAQETSDASEPNQSKALLAPAEEPPKLFQKISPVQRQPLQVQQSTASLRSAEPPQVRHPVGQEREVPRHQPLREAVS